MHSKVKNIKSVTVSLIYNVNIEGYQGSSERLR